MNSEAEIIQQKLAGWGSLVEASSWKSYSLLQGGFQERTTTTTTKKQNNNITPRAYKYIQTNRGSH